MITAMVEARRAPHAQKTSSTAERRGPRRQAPFRARRPLFEPPPVLALRDTHAHRSLTSPPCAIAGAGARGVVEHRMTRGDAHRGTGASGSRASPCFVRDKKARDQISASSSSRESRESSTLRLVLLGRGRVDDLRGARRLGARALVGNPPRQLTPVMEGPAFRRAQSLSPGRQAPCLTISRCPKPRRHRRHSSVMSRLRLRLRREESPGDALVRDETSASSITRSSWRG
jgi:hypothetical protein